MNRLKFLAAILALFITTLSFGQQIDANQGYAEPNEYLVSIPYTEVKGKIIIEVAIAGKKRKFILDTGAPTAISENLYRELLPKSLGKVQISDQSGAKDSINVVSMSGIQINGVTFSDIPAIVTKDSKVFFECFGAEGFIGSNLLRNSVIQFDSRTKTITITDNPKQLDLKKKYGNKMELSAAQSNPFVSISLNKGKHTATEKILFDTGDDGFYKLSIGAYKQLSGQLDVFNVIAESEGSFTVGLHGAAQRVYQYAVHIPVLTVNNVEFKNVVAKTTHAETSRFGSAILNHGKATLDYKNKRFYFEPFENKSSIELKEKIWAIDPTVEGEKIVVGIIWDKALEDKINLGDEILQFDGIDYRQMDFCEIVRSNNKSDKAKAVLTLKDIHNGEIKTVEILKL